MSASAKYKAIIRDMGKSPVRAMAGAEKLTAAAGEIAAVLEAAERIASEDRYKFRSLDHALSALEEMLS